MKNRDVSNSMKKARFLIGTKNIKVKMNMKGSAIGNRKPQDTAERQHGKSHR
jgi:hypothetical protein